MLLGTRLRVLRLNDLLGVFQQIRDAARAKIPKWRTQTQQRMKITQWQFITKSVLDGAVNTRHLPMGQQRTQRKTLSFHEFQPGIRLTCMRDALLTLHHTLLDH